MKVYGIYDKSALTLHSGWLRTCEDIRELYAAFEQLLNDPQQEANILSRYVEDFQLVCLGEIVKDHIEPPTDANGNNIPYYVVKELRELKHTAS